MHDLLQAEETINKAEVLFRQLWEISVDGMRLIDEAGNVILVNDAYCNIVEMDKNDLLGKSFSIVYHPSEQNQVLELYKRDAVSNEIKTHFERENTLWNGKKRWFEFSNSFLNLQDSGKVTLSIIKDITERKKYEKELIESEKKFRMIFNNANDAVFVTQLTEDKTYGDFVEVNDVACERFGYTREEFLLLSPSAIIYPKQIDEFNKSIEKLLTDNHVVYQVTHKAKDRRLIPSEISSHLFIYEGKMTVLSIARDITERKQAEEKLKRSSIILRNLASHLQSVREEERGLIAREIHDELGQVLTALKIQISLLSNKLKSDQEELKNKILTLSDLIDGAVDSVQKIASKLRPVILDELGLLSAIEWQTQEFQRVSGIHCSLSLPSTEINFEKEKSTAVFRIFQEALTNVMRHSKASAVSISVQKSNNLFSLQVADNGIGITNEQIKDSHSLGLIGINERAMLVGGEVSIEGIAGKGTVVKVEVPL